jgi:hypothetical protein
MRWNGVDSVHLFQDWSIRIVNLHAQLQTWKTTLLDSSSRLLVQCILSYTTYLEAVSFIRKLGTYRTVP